MADLIDDEADNDPIEKPLRLSIRWHTITDSGWEGDITGILQIGLFLGDEPLFAPAAYEHFWRDQEKWLLPGYFYGEDDDCRLLDDLWALLSTGKKMDFEDVEPIFRLMVGPNVLWPEGPQDRDADFYNVLAIIEHGGPWHTGAMGLAGPAAFFTTDRCAVEKFFYDLLDEALDPGISDEVARRILTERFKETLEKRPEGA